MTPRLPGFIWTNPALPRQYKAAVSLHSHTAHSRELLDFIPRYAGHLPVAASLLRFEEQRFAGYNGGLRLNYSNAWWTPPLGARDAWDLERGQIEHRLGLRAMISLTDHDTIDAPLTLHVLDELRDIPVSLEWTVPYGESFLHLGVHNLPPRWCAEVMERLTSYTADPVKGAGLAELMCLLHGFPSVLIVLNHPLWDEQGIGAAKHRQLASHFLHAHREWIHAVELNGLRSWRENRDVVQLAAEFTLPVISGGDRHGCEPNANINLTQASTFAEFVSEVRDDGHSKVLFLSQYREPLHLRILQGVLDVLREYPEFRVDRRRWTDRVFFRSENNVVSPLSSFWTDDGPRVVKLFVASVRLLGRRPIRNALHAVLAGKQEVPI